MPKKKEKPFWRRIRIPLPWQRGGPHSTPKGRKGYDRKAAKEGLRKEMDEVGA